MRKRMNRTEVDESSHAHLATGTDNIPGPFHIDRGDFLMRLLSKWNTGRQVIDHVNA